jgi:hypothetical protein
VAGDFFPCPPSADFSDMRDPPSANADVAPADAVLIDHRSTKKDEIVGFGHADCPHPPALLAGRAPLT